MAELDPLTPCYVTRLDCEHCQDSYTLHQAQAELPKALPCPKCGRQMTVFNDLKAIGYTRHALPWWARLGPKSYGLNQMRAVEQRRENKKPRGGGRPKGV